VNINRVYSKQFLVTLFWKQNAHHKHGVLLHTLRVFYHTLKAKEYKMLTVALLHDVGKPLVAYQKDEDIEKNEYSFTDHEEKSHEVIKDWRFVSEYTKTLVRYHYLIRDIDKHKTKDPERHYEKLRIWNTLTPQLQDDLRRFLRYDDFGKGKRRRNNDKRKKIRNTKV
jgi:predicted HD phosphohydrolase